MVRDCDPVLTGVVEFEFGSIRVPFRFEPPDHQGSVKVVSSAAVSDI